MDEELLVLVDVEQGGDIASLACEVLCMLHALYMLHRSAHWQVMGHTYYGDHLLFQRLYEPLDAEIDTLAERMVEAFGVEHVDAEKLAMKTSEIVSGYCSSCSCPFERGLNAELDVISAVAEFMDSLELEGKGTLGWDDFLGAVTSQHETHVYLLKQRTL